MVCHSERVPLRPGIFPVPRRHGTLLPLQVFGLGMGLLEFGFPCGYVPLHRDFQQLELLLVLSDITICSGGLTGKEEGSQPTQKASTSEEEAQLN